MPAKFEQEWSVLVKKSINTESLKGEILLWVQVASCRERDVNCEVRNKNCNSNTILELHVSVHST